jgi:hypothetical protein
MLVGRVQEDPPEATGREDSLLGDKGHDLPGLGVEGIATETGERLVAVARIVRIMRAGEQVDGHAARPARDARHPAHPSRHRLQNRVAGGILRMDDPPCAVAPLAREIECASGVAVEAHAQFVEQQRFHGSRALPHQLLDRRRIGGLAARLLDVASQQL